MQDNATVGALLSSSSASIIWPRLTSASAVLSALDERIQAAVEPKVEQAEQDLAAIIGVELGKLGINPDLTGTASFVRGIADRYRENLVDGQVKALADLLVSAAPAAV